MKCPSCGYSNPEGAPYCSMCQASFSKPSSGAMERTYKPPTATPAAAAADEYNWFQRHLNLTFLLPLFAVGFGGFLMGLTRYHEIMGMAIFEIVIIAASILTFILGAWYVHRKNRSFAWLVFLFLGLIGLIVFLCLENHEDERPRSKSRPSQSPSLTTPPKYGY